MTRRGAAPTTTARSNHSREASLRMRWNWGCRVITALLAAWSFVVQEEPAALHTCAMHDTVHALVLSTAVPDAGGDHAEHHAAGTADDSHHDGGRHQRQCCTCLGPSCNAQPVALIASTVFLAAARRVRSSQPVVRRVTFTPSEPEHARPPSVGPPAVRIG
jgi:hypothetical protein